MKLATMQVFRPQITGQPVPSSSIPPLDVQRIPSDVLERLYDYQLEGVR